MYVKYHSLEVRIRILLMMWDVQQPTAKRVAGRPCIRSKSASAHFPLSWRTVRAPAVVVPRMTITPCQHSSSLTVMNLSTYGIKQY